MHHLHYIKFAFAFAFTFTFTFTFTLSYIILHYITNITVLSITILHVTDYILHITYYITMHTLHYITLHYITLHYITLHYITLHYITLRRNTHPIRTEQPPNPFPAATQQTEHPPDRTRDLIKKKALRRNTHPIRSYWHVWGMRIKIDCRLSADFTSIQHTCLPKAPCSANNKNMNIQKIDELEGAP